MNIKKIIPMFCKTKCLLLAFLLAVPCSLQAWEYVGDDYEDHYYEDDEIEYSPTGDEVNSGEEPGADTGWFGNFIDGVIGLMESAYDGLAGLGESIAGNAYNSEANEAARYAAIGEVIAEGFGSLGNLLGNIWDYNVEHAYEQEANETLRQGAFGALIVGEVASLIEGTGEFLNTLDNWHWDEALADLGGMLGQYAEAHGINTPLGAFVGCVGLAANFGAWAIDNGESLIDMANALEAAINDSMEWMNNNLTPNWNGEPSDTGN